jgi:hypothetical protein
MKTLCFNLCCVKTQYQPAIPNKAQYQKPYGSKASDANPPKKIANK